MPAFTGLTTAMLSAGVIIGMIVGYAIARITRVREERVYRRFRGDIVGLVYDVDTGELDLVGLYPLGESLVSGDPINPLIVARPPGLTFSTFKPLGKPATFVIVKGVTGFATNPDTLGNLGIAKVVIGGDEWQGSGNPKADAVRLVKKLLSFESPYRGYVRLNPNLRFGLAVEVPRVVQSLVEMITNVASSSMTVVEDMLKAGKYMRDLLEKQYKITTARRGFWIQLLTVGGIILFLILVTLRLLPAR